VNDLFEHALKNVNANDMMRITIQNRENQNDKPIGISFRGKDQLAGDVIWKIYERIYKSNSRFNAIDTLVVTVHRVRLPQGFC